MSIDIHIPGYELKRQVGKGGMATVYLAVQQNFGRDVALKMMSPHLQADPSFTTRFQREARIVAQMHHSHIVPVYDVGQYQGHEYLAMEFLSGGDLRSRIARDVGLAGALGVCIAVAQALDYAHGKGVLHRDVKPENILFREDGTPVLTDFGIARSADGGTALTQTGVLVGTPAYMSPEQAKGVALDGRTDLYALGVVLYELLTGIQPYRADSAVSLLLKHLNEPIPRLPRGVAHLQPLLDRALAKEPTERFATGAEMAQALLECLPASSNRSGGRGANGRSSDASGRKGRGLSARAGWLIGGLGAAALAIATAVLWPDSPRPTLTLRAEATSIERGQSTKLHWDAKNATGVTIEPDIGAVEPRGSRDISPTADVTYRATTIPSGEEVSTRISVSAQAIAPPTLTLRADPPSIQRGQITTLRWQAANATSVAIEPGIGAVANDGSLVVRPSKSTTYTARTTGRGGTTVASVAVIVEERDEPASEPQAVAPVVAAAPRTQSVPAPRIEQASITAVTPPQEQEPEPSSAAVRMLLNRTELSAAPVSEICEQTSRVDDPVEMRLAKSVPLSDGSSMPVDTVLTGRIAGKRFVGNQPPLVEIEMERITMEGRSVAVTANPFTFYMSRPSVGGRVVKGAIIGAATGAVVGLILKKNVGAIAAGGAVAGGAIGAATGPREACVSQADTVFVFKVTRDTAIR